MVDPIGKPAAPGPAATPAPRPAPAAAAGAPIPAAAAADTLGVDAARAASRAALGGDPVKADMDRIAASLPDPAEAELLEKTRAELAKFKAWERLQALVPPKFWALMQQRIEGLLEGVPAEAMPAAEAKARALLLDEWNRRTPAEHLEFV